MPERRASLRPETFRPPFPSLLGRGTLCSPWILPPSSSALGGEPRLHAELRRVWGFDRLKPLQEEAIAVALAGRDSLVVLPTGGGKSLCYQAPAVVGGGLTLVVSPLIALMKDQVDGLVELGVPAAAYNSMLPSGERARCRGASRAASCASSTSLPSG